MGKGKLQNQKNKYFLLSVFSTIRQPFWSHWRPLGETLEFLEGGLWSLLEPSWGPLGRSLEPLGDVLGALGSLLGALGASWGSFWHLLGSLWGLLGTLGLISGVAGGVLGGFWERTGCQNVPKRVPSASQITKFATRTHCFSKCVFDAFCNRFPKVYGIARASVGMLNMYITFRFLLEFCKSRVL